MGSFSTERARTHAPSRTPSPGRPLRAWLWYDIRPVRDVDARFSSARRCWKGSRHPAVECTAEPQDATFPSDSVSFVSVGDGSVNNAMFLAALNMSEYAQHRSFKCPIVFAVTDNDMCISLKGYGWMERFVEGRLMKLHEASGADFGSVLRATEDAVAYSFFAPVAPLGQGYASAIWPRGDG